MSMHGFEIVRFLGWFLQLGISNIIYLAKLSVSTDHIQDAAIWKRSSMDGIPFSSSRNGEKRIAGSVSLASVFCCRSFLFLYLTFHIKGYLEVNGPLQSRRLSTLFPCPDLFQTVECLLSLFVTLSKQPSTTVSQLY